MCYILIMNKDVIYIEPEDDITDIITKIENSKEKIVALVPPKKAGVFRSVVNIKLISKVGTTSEKTIVLVTTDPSIVKLAAATKMPVTKNLQTPPAIPTAETEIEEVSEEELVDEPEGEVEEEITEETIEATEDDEKEEPTSKKDKRKEKADKKSEKKKPTGKTGNPIIGWIKSHKKLSIFGGIGILVLILVLVWAFAIAPAATVNVSIKTENNNFSENITFTTNAADEDATAGKFYLQEEKLESVSEVSFTATGQKNNGEKATGEVIVYTFFKREGTVAINAGSTFTINGLSFTSDKNVSLSWGGDDFSDCDNKNNATQITNSGCQISGRVTVTATGAGTKYNIAASNSGWSTTANVSVYSDKAMSGGTDDIVTVVEQADIEKAKNELKASNEDENKEKLFDSLGEDVLVVEASFNQDTSAAVATPAAGEAVKDGEQPTLKATTTASVYVIDKTKVEEFIKEKAKLGDDQKIYEIKDPFIENFLKTGDGYTGKLKTTYASGPKITDSDVVEIVKGKGVGDARHDLNNINGVAKVEIETSYPWVNAIPGDTNKITVNVSIEEE